MSKSFPIYIMLVLTCLNSKAQHKINRVTTTFSERYGMTFDTPSTIEVDAPTEDDIANLIKLSEEDNAPYIISKLLPVSIEPNGEEEWDSIGKESKIWRRRIVSHGALGLVLHFDSFQLPDHGELMVYSENRKSILGTYTSVDNPSTEGFSIGILPGEAVVIEYIESKTKEKITDYPVPFRISEISYIFRGIGIKELRSTGYGASGSCEVDVNCEEGDNWRQQQKSVARIYTVSSSGGSWCSGSLINNSANDGAPLLLTAYHCGGDATATQMGQWIFFFNYESEECGSAIEPEFVSFSGCTKKSGGNYSGGSDFLLVELNATAAQIKEADLIYNGWDASGTASTSGVSIHHPAGDVKKISTYTTAISGSSYDICSPNSHWKVNWSATANGFGVTEGGSSGSPLFDSAGLVIGTLSGGYSSCASSAMSDYYGKLSEHWLSNGSVPTTQLRPWLDPLNTGMLVCNAFDPNNIAAAPEASIKVNKREIIAGDSVVFSDKSTNTPSIWEWSFEGGSPSTSTEKKQTVIYNTPGIYSVRLIAGNTYGNDTLEEADVIRVYDSVFSAFAFNFEKCEDFDLDRFMPCISVDGDGKPTYTTGYFDFKNEGYTGAFIAMNPTELTDDSTWYAHRGKKYAACFSTTYGSNSDWFITPKLQVTPQTVFSFWAKSLTAQYGLERFRVLVSENGSDTAQFVRISQNNYISAPSEWTRYEFSLTAYAGKKIHIAIQCVSNNAFVFMLDDIEFSVPLVIKSSTISASSITSGDGSISLQVSGGTPPYRVEWNNNPLLLGITLTNLLPGKYYAMVSDAVGIVKDTTITVDYKPNSINMADNTGVSVCYNPDIKMLSLEAQNDYPADISLFDIFGHKRYSISNKRGAVTINMAKYAYGVYVVQVIQNGQTKSYRILVW